MTSGLFDVLSNLELDRTNGLSGPPREDAAMSKYIVVVADTQSARIFALKDSLTPEIESSPKLVEEQAIINPEKLIEAKKPRGTPASGRNKSGAGGSYAFDDHRGKHAQDELRKFSGIIVKETLKQARKASAHTLVMVAGGKTLGVIRAAVAGIKVKGLSIRECELELTGEPAAKIQSLLARRELLPGAKKPSQRVRK